MSKWKFISLTYDSENACWYALDDKGRMWEGAYNKDFIIEWDICSELPTTDKEYYGERSEN